ncbi:unnamed protein product, partial [Closterium sp. NIES-65]
AITPPPLDVRPGLRRTNRLLFSRLWVRPPALGQPQRDTWRFHPGTRHRLNQAKARWDEARRKGFHRLLQGWLPLRSPMDGCSDCFVSSPFGPRWGSFHRGVDVAAEEGEPIRAARSGVVTHVGDMDVYGNLVTLAHEAGFTTHYAHCSKMLVQAGQRVRAGQVVALVGNTGRSMGPHLHFEASPSHGSAIYIVRLRSAPPIASYRGGFAGYPTTAAWDNNPNGHTPGAASSDEAGDGVGAASVPSNGGVGTASVAPAAAAAATATSGSGGTNRPLWRPRLNVRAPGVRAFKQLLQRMQQAVLRDSGVAAGKMRGAAAAHAKGGNAAAHAKGGNAAAHAKGGNAAAHAKGGNAAAHAKGDNAAAHAKGDNAAAHAKGGNAAAHAKGGNAAAHAKGDNAAAHAKGGNAAVHAKGDNAAAHAKGGNAAAHAKGDNAAAHAKGGNSYVHTDNGFSAALTAAQVQRMRRHPSVASVTLSRTITRRRAVTTAADGHKSLNLPHARAADVAAPAVATPAAATPAAAAATPAGAPSDGEGTVIGILDSGVWPEHPSFDDTGYSSTPPAGWAGTCPTTSDFACNNKIIGGGIFRAGFESEYGGQGPHDDEWASPRDSDGHGTWCAGAAAGNSGVEVLGGGTISGVAPRARLAVYKVYWYLGGPGESVTTDADVFAAVDQAVADGVDVLTLSLDNTNKNADWDQFDKWNWTYFDDVPFIGALAAGVTVSFAVGDEGRSFYRYLYGPFPAIDNFAPYYISVGASTVPQESLTSSSTTTAAALESPANTTGPSASTLLGTQLPTTISPAATSLPMVPEWSSTSPLAARGCTVCRPKKARPSNTILKPDIIAPGADILAAAPGTTVGETGSFSAYNNETAVAAAHVASVAALIIQQHLDWTPAQVMSAMMTTAGSTDNSNRMIRNVNGKPATLWQMGAGHVFPARALDPGLTYDAGEQDFRNFLAGMNFTMAREAFGQVPLKPIAARHLNRPSISLVNIPLVVNKLAARRTVTSVSGTTSTYRVTVTVPEAVRVRVVPSQFTIAPGQRVSFKVKVVVRRTFNNFKYVSRY